MGICSGTMKLGVSSLCKFRFIDWFSIFKVKNSWDTKATR